MRRVVIINQAVLFLNNHYIFVPEIKGFGETEDDTHSLQGAENEIILIFVFVTFGFPNVPNFRKELNTNK